MRAGVSDDRMHAQSPTFAYEVGVDVVCDLFQWRRLVMSKNGPDEPNTRYLLLAIALHMNERCENAYPSQGYLAKAMSLDRKTVGKHMRIAIREGWILRRPRYLEDGSTAATDLLVATIPVGLEIHIGKGKGRRKPAH